MANKRVFLRMFICLLFVTFCIPLDSVDVYVSMLKGDIFSIDVHYFWLNSIIFAGLFGQYFIITISAFPYSDKFYYEYEQGIWRYVIARQGCKKYIISNLLNSFLIGGTTSFLGGILFVLLTNQFCPLFTVDRLIEVNFLPYYKLLERNPIIYFVIVLYLLFLDGSIWSCLTYTFSYFVPIKEYIYLFPFIGSFLFTRINALMNISSKYRLDYIFRGRVGFKNIYSEFIITLFITIIIGFICYKCILKKLNWRLNNE